MPRVPVALGILVGCAQASPELLDHWVATDLHVHSSVGSNDTDGLGTREALPPAMERAGLDLVFLSDHSNAAGSMHCDDVEDCPNLGPETTEGWPDTVWMASEISPIESLESRGGPRGHTGCLAPEQDGFPGLEAFIDRPPGEVTGGEGVDQCKEAGGWAVVNHPYGPAPWVAYDWTSERFDAMEVYNGGARFDTWDAQAVVEWERRLAEGQDVVAVGGSDCHRWGIQPPGDTLNPALGWPITWVNVDDGETALDGLKAGRVVIAEPGTTLSLEARSQREAAGPGQHLEGPATVIVRASAVEGSLRVELRSVDGEELAAKAVGTDEVRLEVEVARGTVYARVWPIEEEIGLDRGGVALTNPVVIR